MTVFPMLNPNMVFTHYASLGAISDSNTSKYRRRYWIALSTAVLVVSTLVLAYCQDIASFFVDLFPTGAGDWDPKQRQQV
jgi:solute carrier family 45 protein 1/2/4